MSRPPPPLNLVRSFEAAARHLSFTRAAGELGCTQAAISTHVRALESHIGRTLFIRRARSLVLTETGEAYLPTLRQALAQIDSATEAIAAGRRTRSVMIACPVSLAQNWLTGVLAAFHRDHPGVEVLVHGTVWDTPEDASADLLIAVHREGAVPAGFEPLWPERLMLLCAPAQARTLGSPTDLAALPRIAVAGRQDYWALMLEALDLPPPHTPPILRSNSTNVALELSARGLGTVVAPVSLGSAFVEQRALAVPFDARPASPWLYTLRQPARHASAPIRALADRLRAARPL
jgi:LysR family transcriptional regulator, glycine cleavage system transcriptional activator